MEVPIRIQEVNVGEDAVIPCTTFDERSIWERQAENNSRVQTIFTDFTVWSDFKERFSVERVGWANLTIRSVQPSDSSIYKCIDDQGNGIIRPTRLIVTG